MNEEIEARLERIERRLDALEARPAYRQAAPPVYAAPPPKRNDDLESVIGARWLPRAGAMAVVAALAYLVALGLQRGVITPAMVVVGIAAACLGVVGLGLRLRDEREAFGHVLVGLGTGGLYVDAVGAHLYQNLLSSEAMVVACLAVSLASLGYGFWRALPAFLGIGLAGGLVAALMPLAKGGTATAAGLLLLVAVPAFATAGARRWPAAVAASWIACTLASAPMLLSNDVPFVRLLPLDATLLLALAAWAVSTERFPASDPPGAFPLAAATIAGVAALFQFYGVSGALHLFGLGAALAAFAYPFAARPSARRVAEAGVVLLAALAPFGLPGHASDAALAVLALVGAAVTVRAKALAPLVVVQASLALVAYVYHALVGEIPVAQEAGLLVLLSVAAVGAALAVDLREARVAAGIVVWALATRLALVALDVPDNAAITVAWTAVCAGLFVVGFFRRRSELRQLGLLVAGVTAAKVVLVDLAGLDAALKAAVLLGLGLVLLGGGYAYVRAKGNLPA